MKDQKLYDIFHSYHPEMSSEEDFMARLNEQMDAIDKKRIPSLREKTKLRPFLPWAAGIAAAIAVGLFLFKPLHIPLPWEREFAAEVPLSHGRGVRGEAVPERIAMQTMDADPLASFEETVAEIEQSGQQLQLAIAEMKK